MKKYEFQLLRFLPDLVSGEFVNVGLVLYCPEERFLMAAELRNVKRIHEFFPGADARHILRSAAFIKNQLQETSRQWADELNFPLPNKLSEITSALLPPNDAALFFTETFAGIDLSPKAAFDDLCKRLLFKYIEMPVTTSLTDEEVWNKLYKQHFKEKQLLSRLLPHTVRTSKDRFEFEHAWKNGAWHCYEPVSFELQQPDSVKKKVYHWKGKMQELGTSAEPVKIHLMTALPQQPELRRFVLDMLQGQTFGQAHLEIVQPEQAEQITSQLQLELNAIEA